jgi:hypothetical protein
VKEIRILQSNLRSWPPNCFTEPVIDKERKLAGLNVYQYNPDKLYSGKGSVQLIGYIELGTEPGVVVPK